MNSQNLSASLTFHASFDHGPDADFGAGDRRLYSVSTGAEPKEIVLTPGLGDPPLTLAQARGRYGAALAFTAENTHTVSYKAEKNVAYAQDGFQGTISFWLFGDTADIPGQYCDPLQLTDKDYSDACIWVDITKNDSPSDLRLGVFGNQKEWDLTDTRHENAAFYWRLVKVAEPPVAKTRWTHIAITWDGINSAGGGRARFYLDGEHRGASNLIRERFTWDIAKTRISLGIGNYIGMIDDFAVFNRPLTPDEIRALIRLEHGVADLYGKG
ncbi:MAG: LamG domain-containing protein [candidate division Zixibacteria bacterium]|nr:LamG domain-containing protein [candidate division Zixibacteria bacterium]